MTGDSAVLTTALHDNVRQGSIHCLSFTVNILKGSLHLDCQAKHTAVYKKNRYFKPCTENETFLKTDFPQTRINTQRLALWM